MKPSSVIDAPSDLGLRHTGVDGLPDALRAAGLLEGLPDMRYAGRIPAAAYSPLRDPSSGIVNLAAIASFSLRLAERTATVTARQGAQPAAAHEAPASPQAS